MSISESVVAHPLPFQVVVRDGPTVVAESSRAVRRDAPAGSELWIPAADVRDGWRTAVELRQGDGALDGFVGFDPEQLMIDIVDGRPGDAARDVTTKRFPTWGDAADLFAILDVREDADGRFRGAVHAAIDRPVVEGSQLLAQTIVAASRRAPERRVVSASMVFARAADARLPVSIDLSEVTSGRTFTTLTATAEQRERVCAVGTLLLDATAPSIIEHRVPPPDVAGPYESVPFDMSVTGRDLRIVDGAYAGDPDAPVGPPVLDAWVRFREPPADPALHAALLVQFTGHLSIAAALRPHAGVGEDQAHRSLSTAINAINVAIHREVRADRWMLYHHESTFAGDGMTHSQCRVHDEKGDLLASFTVVAMVRAFAAAASEPDARTAL